MYNRNKYLKRELAKLSPEEREKELKRLVDMAQIALWREQGLKAWAEHVRGKKQDGGIAF